MSLPPALVRIADGRWYDVMDSELEVLRAEARRAVHQHATMEPDARGACAPMLASLLGALGAGSFVEAPLHVSYGRNLHLGSGSYLNAGCTILDSAPVRVGARTMLGPGVQIYCADHHREANERRRGQERALPVTLGEDVWIGGGATVLPGITIGDSAIVAARAVVTRDVAPGSRVAGMPARPL